MVTFQPNLFLPISCNVTTVIRLKIVHSFSIRFIWVLNIVKVNAK